MTQRILSKPGEEQCYTIKFVFRTRHNPGTDNHLKQLAGQCLQEKYKINDDGEVWV